MKSIFIAALLVSLWTVSCKKDIGELDTPGNLHISFKLDGRLIMGTANDTTGNGSGYMICTTIPSCHFDYGAGYGLENSTAIEFWLGQINSTQLRSTFSEFRTLFSEGVKIYDSLFIYNQVNGDRVEVFYRDENGKNWSSTYLRRDSSGGIVERTVNQPGSNFIIDEIKVLNVNGQPGGGIKIKGRFSCIVYEESGIRQKVITDGEFIAKIFKLD